MKLLSLLTLLILSEIAYGTSISHDSLPPYKINLFGQNVIVYSIEQDKSILKCFEERKILLEQSILDSLTIDSNNKLIETYKVGLQVNLNLVQNLNEEVELYKQQESILVRRLLIEKDVNDKLIAKLNEVYKKEQKVKVRNTILFVIGGTILTGVLTGLIVKSVL